MSLEPQIKSKREDEQHIHSVNGDGIQNTRVGMHVLRLCKVAVRVN